MAIAISIVRATSRSSSQRAEGLPAKEAKNPFALARVALIITIGNQQLVKSLLAIEQKEILSGGGDRR
jgi:hypothetical protein